jgi:hypothetical protein
LLAVHPRAIAAVQVQEARRFAVEFDGEVLPRDTGVLRKDKLRRTHPPDADRRARLDNNLPSGFGSALDFEN